LVRIDLLVPESSLAGARMFSELPPKRVHRASIPLLSGALVEQEERLSRGYLVQVVIGQIIRANASIRQNELVDIVPDVVVVALVGGSFVESLNASIINPTS